MVFLAVCFKAKHWQLQNRDLHEEDEVGCVTIKERVGLFRVHLLQFQNFFLFIEIDGP